MNSKTFGFLLLTLFVLSILSVYKVASASVLSLTNAEKLSLSTSTPVGTKVQVTDGFVVSNYFSYSVFLIPIGIQNGKTLYSTTDWQEVINQGSGGIAIFYDGRGWNVGNLEQGPNGITDVYLPDGDEDYPWQVIVPENYPIITHPAVQELASPGSKSILVNGAGTNAANGIYTKRGSTDIDGILRNYYVKIGSQDYTESDAISWNGSQWSIWDTDGNIGSYYFSSDDVDSPVDAVWETTNGDDPPPTLSINPNVAVFVSGAGTIEANGIYIESGILNAKPRYTLLGHDPTVLDYGVMWENDRWLIYDTYGGDALYGSSDDVAYPWLAIFTDNDIGSLPLPAPSSITQGELDAGVTVAGTGITGFDGVYPNVVSVVSVLKIEETNGENIIGNIGGYYWTMGDLDFSSQYVSDVGSTPFGVSWYEDNATPPPPTVTQNNIASEANWEVTTLPTPTSLSYQVQPSTTQTSSTISPSIKVNILDEDDNLIDNATNEVTLSIGNNPSAGVLSGTLTQSAVDGVATFNDLSIDNEGNGYTLVASATDLDPSTSSSFNISSSGGSTHHKSGGTGGGSSTTVTPTTHPITPPADPFQPFIPPPDCKVGDLFSSSTGSSCTSPLPPPPQPLGCIAGLLYSPQTGEKCQSLTTPPLPGPIPLVVPVPLTRDLTLGSQGDDVASLQTLLVQLGYLVIPPGVNKGYFGSLTQQALAKYQATHGITPSLGYFGPVTRAYINSH